MIRLALMLVLAASAAAQAEPMCDVKICNKISRFSLDPWSHMKDSMGENCFWTRMPQNEAVAGKVLTSESRWYQGSTINPTKKSVTSIKQVGECK